MDYPFEFFQLNSQCQVSLDMSNKKIYWIYIYWKYLTQKEARVCGNTIVRKSRAPPPWLILRGYDFHDIHINYVVITYRYFIY